MAKVSKRAAAIAAKIDRNKFYPVAEALALVKDTATACLGSNAVLYGG